MGCLRGTAVIFVVLIAAGCDQLSAGTVEMTYPESRTVDQVDDLHGTKVADPYRWLEQDVRESEAVADWVERQNQVTFGHLSRIPEREAIEARLTELWNYERFSVPVRKGGRYFFHRNDGLQNQAVLYVQDSLEAEPRVLLDPNTWSDDGTVALAEANPSPDGRYLAYTVQDGGSDWRTARVLDIASSETLPDTLEWLKFTGIAWAGDGSGFYYSRYPAPDADGKFTSLNKNHSVYFHRLETSQAADRQVYARPDFPDWGFSPQVSHDGRHLVIEVFLGTDERNQVVYQHLADPDSEPFMLVEGFEAGYSFVGSRGDELYFRTNADAPRGRLVKVAPAAGERPAFEEVIREGEHVLVSASLIGEQVVAHYLRDASSAVSIFDAAGRPVRELTLPGIGSVAGFTGDPRSPETFFSFESFSRPPEIWRYDVARDERQVFRRAGLRFDPDAYVVEQVFFTSKDGTRVPMFVTHRRGIERDGGNPTLLYGYGGFNISLTPDFSVARLAWLEMGGVYAVANLRGGGEYGEE